MRDGLLVNLMGCMELMMMVGQFAKDGTVRHLERMSPLWVSPSSQWWWRWRFDRNTMMTVGKDGEVHYCFSSLAISILQWRLSILLMTMTAMMFVQVAKTEWPAIPPLPLSTLAPVNPLHYLHCNRRWESGSSGQLFIYFDSMGFSNEDWRCLQPVSPNRLLLEVPS